MTLAQQRVAEIMKTELATLGVDDHLDLVQDIMHLGRVRHMPVLDGGKLVGVLSSHDLLASSLTRCLEFEPEHRRDFLRSVEVREAMTSDPITVSPDTTLAEAALLLCQHQIRCLPVLREDDTLVGLVTETDLVRHAYLDPEAESSERTVSARG